MYPCVNCNNKFKTEQGLLRHMSAKHDSLNNVKLEKDELMVLLVFRYWLRNISFDNVSNTRAIEVFRFVGAEKVTTSIIKEQLRKPMK